MPTISKRVLAIEESKSIALARVIQDLKNQGQTIIPFNVGEPDFLPPQKVLEHTSQALMAGETRYSLVAGVLRLRELLAKDLSAEWNREINCDQICISNGSKQVLYNIFQAILNPGDEVLVPTPYWVTFPESIKLAAGTPKFVDHQNLRIDLSDLENKITKQTKAILINTPNNPTGIVYSEEEIKAIYQLAEKHDLWLISDEAYDTLVYGDKKHFSPAQLGAKALERTFIVRSFSKSHCLTGFRLGYVISHASIIKDINKLQGHMTGNNCTFAQYGGIASLELQSNFYQEMVQTFEKRRDLSYQLCHEIFPCVYPEGAFYLFPDVSQYLNEETPTDSDLSLKILKEAQVALLPGSAFGQPGHLRICFATNEENIKKGFAQIKKVLCK